GRKSLGKRAAESDPVGRIQSVETTWSRTFVRQVAVNVVLDDGHAVAGGEREQLAARGLGHERAERVGEIGRHKDRRDASAAERGGGGVEVESGGAGGHGDDLELQLGDDVEQAVKGG